MQNGIWESMEKAYALPRYEKGIDMPKHTVAQTWTCVRGVKDTIWARICAKTRPMAWSARAQRQ